MSESRHRLFYIPGALGGVHGSSQSAVDVLIDLLASNIPVTVLNHKRYSLPTKINGVALGSPEWVNPPVSFPLQPNRHLPHRTVYWAFSKWRGILRNRRLCQADLIFFNGMGSHDMWPKIAPHIKKRTVMIVRESPGHFNEHFPRDLEWALDVLNSHTHYVFVSSRCRDEWIELGALEGKESSYIPNCCQEDAIARLLSHDHLNIRERLGLPVNAFVAVCVASLQYRKGQDIILDYFSELLNIAPNLMMIFAGPIFSWGGGDRLVQKMRESPYNKRLLFVGARLDALDYIYAADVLVLPARAEAMPRVVLEAMALKTPVIASNVGGIPELIQNGKTGLMFSHDYPKGLVDAFTTMASNSSLREDFAERAYQRYWSNFTRAHQIKRYARLIQKLLGQTSLDYVKRQQT